MIEVHSGDGVVLDDGDAGAKLRERHPNGRFYGKWVTPPPHIVEGEIDGEMMRLVLEPDYFRRPRTVFGLEELVRDLESEYGAS